MQCRRLREFRTIFTRRAINLNGFQGFGDATGLNTEDVTKRPSYITNDMVTWVHGRHTFKIGAELRKMGRTTMSAATAPGRLPSIRSRLACRVFRVAATR